MGLLRVEHDDGDVEELAEHERNDPTQPLPKDAEWVTAGIEAPKQHQKEQREHTAPARTAIIITPSEGRSIPTTSPTDSVLYMLNGKVEQGKVVGRHKKKGWLSVHTEDGKRQ